MPNPGRSNAQRNREIDALDLGASLEVLPAAADPTFSPLAQVGRPAATDPAPPAKTRTKKRSGAAPGGARGGRQRPVEAGAEAARSVRDETRDRLVREALQARGLDPDTVTRKGASHGGKHRPTIELTPEQYAAIQVAITVRPDIFGGSLVSFVRSCATNWETIAGALDSTDDGQTSG